MIVLHLIFLHSFRMVVLIADQKNSMKERILILGDSSSSASKNVTMHEALDFMLLGSLILSVERDTKGHTNIGLADIRNKLPISFV